MNSNSGSATRRLIAIFCIQLLAAAPAAAQSACDDGHVILQVLGSGGPFGVVRASAGYLVWVDGVARVMVDAGGGTFTRFHEAGARVGDLELLALSHFHPDHSAEVPALLWIQSTDMLVSGPSGSEAYPSVTEYVTGLFGPEGVFRAVSDGKGLKNVTVDVKSGEPTEVFANKAMRVTGIGVPHGIVPAVAYRVEVGDLSMVFSSDQNGTDPAFVEFATGADVLVAHVAIPETQRGFAANLHAKPTVWGQMATDAKIGTLVVSHLSGIIPGNEGGDLVEFDEKLRHIRSRYDGPLVIAEDLMCIPVGAR